MSKKILIAVIVIIFGVFILGAAYFFRELNFSTPLVQTPPTTPNPITPTKIDKTPESSPKSKPEPETKSTLPTGPEISIRTGNNISILVKNFYNDKDTKVFDRQGDAIIANNDDYHIEYQTIDQSFFIILMSSNLQSARDSAEQELQKRLGITKDSFCQLRVVVSVPISVNNNAAGVDYGLSFCPNGIPLPKNTHSL